MLAELVVAQEKPVTGNWHFWRSPLGIDHIVSPWGICLTCWRDDHPAEFSAQDNRDWIAGTLLLKDPAYAQELAAAGAQVSLSLRG